MSSDRRQLYGTGHVPHRRGLKSWGRQREGPPVSARALALSTGKGGEAARRLRQPRRFRFHLRNILNPKLVKPRPGRYIFFDKNKKKIYTGSSLNSRRRLLDVWYGRGDYFTVPSKRELRKKIAYVDIVYGNNVFDNREDERNAKEGLPFNVR